MDLQDDLENLQDALGYIHGDLGHLQDDLGHLQDDVRNLKDVLGYLQDDLGNIKDVLDQVPCPNLIADYVWVWSGAIKKSTTREATRGFATRWLHSNG